MTVSREVAVAALPAACDVPALRARNDSATAQTVCMLCPGGFEHAGGIGRWAQYLFAEWPGSPVAPPLVMLDTRSHGHAGIAAAAFVRTLGQIVGMRMRGEIGLLHVNLSVRGSTIRKTIVSNLAWWLGIPTVIHLHSGRFSEFYAALPPWAKRAVRQMYARADRAIVLGKVWEDVLAEQVGVPRSKIVVLPNAVPDQSSAVGQPLVGPCHIVMLGRVGAPKGVPELMQALGSDILRDLSWRITIAGDGDVAPYRAEAGRLGIADKISFVGWVDSPGVARLMRTADVLVLPSRSENLPVAVVEAMSYGIPVVTTPVGATPEIVVNEESALLVPVQDAPALAAALARMVSDPDLRARIGAGGHAAFRARLDIRDAAQRLAALYWELLDDHRAG